MLTRRVRGAALVEYACILVCVTGLAGAGMKAIHGKAKTTATLAGAQLASGGGNANSGGSSPPGSDARPTGGSSAPSTTPGTGTTNTPKPNKAPKKIDPKTDDTATEGT